MRRLLTISLLALACAAPSFAAKVTFHASMSGANEVTNPAGGTASTGWGVATLTLDPATGEFDLVVNLKSFTETLLDSHIHLAPAGVNGGVIVGLGGEAKYKRAAGKNLHARFSGWVPQQHIETMLGNGTYLNFHTATYPGGAIRGQLIANPVWLFAEMSGDQESTPNDSPATGVAAFQYNPGTKVISAWVEIDDFANAVTGSHIHVAPVGSPGPVTRGLGGEDAYTRNGTSLTGSFLNLPYAGLSVPLLTGGTYINVHSAQYPAGEIRGQIYVTD